MLAHKAGKIDHIVVVERILSSILDMPVKLSHRHGPVDMFEAFLLSISGVLSKHPIENFKSDDDSQPHSPVKE